MAIPGAVSFSYYDSQDCEYSGFDVTANDGTSVTRGNNLRYLTYNIVSVLPITGTEAGGTTLTFTDTGNGFGGTCAVTVGGNAAGAVAVVDSQHLTAVTPAGAVGATNIVITNGDGQVYNLLAIFSYTAAAGGGAVTGEARCWIGTGIGI
jgi:hypothetical protein